jgi:hypothetical protein
VATELMSSRVVLTSTELVKLVALVTASHDRHYSGTSTLNFIAVSASK